MLFYILLCATERHSVCPSSSTNSGQLLHPASPERVAILEQTVAWQQDQINTLAHQIFLHEKSKAVQNTAILMLKTQISELYAEVEYERNRANEAVEYMRDYHVNLARPKHTNWQKFCAVFSKKKP